MKMINEKEIAPGEMEVYVNSLPGLTAGSYQISVTQSLPNSATDNFTTTAPQSFAVAGPQFVLDSAEVHAMFPPANANGNYGQCTPFVVLRNAALPWERLIVNDNSIPWLALLVFQSDEVTLNRTTDSPQITGSVQDFLAPEEGVVKPSINSTDLPPSVLGTSMNSIRVTTDVFTAVMPRLVELSSLSHVRQIDADSQAVPATGVEDIFSIVMANRFPNSESEGGGQLGATNYVHLVSLEGLQGWLVDQPVWPEGAKFVQMASLAAWRFVSIPQPGQTFEDLATALVRAGIPDREALLLRIPATFPRLSEGFTALSYHTLPGPDTFAWYRGPFVPFPAQPLPAGIDVYRHSAQAIIYDQADGVFDNSYAAAFNIGRLTALADPVFLDALRSIRARIGSLNARLLERSKMPHLEGLTIEELAAPGVTRKSFVRLVNQGLSAELSACFRAKQTHARPERTRMLPGSFLFPGEQLPSAPAAQARWFMEKPQVSAFLLEQVQADLPALADWLAKLALLYGISFNHLVPDQRMLPAESIRFFLVDPGWLKVLLDGALAIGINSSREQQAHTLIADPLLTSTIERIPEVRGELLRRKRARYPLPQMPVAGMLLRSALVSGTPGLQVQGLLAGKDAGILRMDRLAPGVLLVLWDQIPDTVNISQPSQGILFGVRDNWTIRERSLTGNIGKETGKTFPDTGNVTQFMRPVSQKIGGRVLNLKPAATGAPGYMIPALSKSLGQPSDLTSAQFSIEMIMAPERIRWNPKAN